MASSLLSILKDVLKLNSMHVDSCEKDTVKISRNNEIFEQTRIIVNARPFRRKQNICPKCGRQCSGYDTKRPERETTWRAPNINGVPVLIRYTPHRIKCPEHGVLTENIPWADGSSHYTEDFNNEVAWAAMQMSRKAVTTFLGINWRTVGNCIKAAKNRIEPDVTVRLHGLRRICVDETGSRKGYEYITVVYDMDRNRAVWVAEGYGREVFERFCLLLTPEERSKIEIVAGDGARWIDSCTKDYFPNATRCIDFFHIVEWANEALDKVRISTASKAAREYELLKARMLSEKELAAAENARLRISYILAMEELISMPQRGRPSKRKLDLQKYISELSEIIGPIDLPSGHMAVELLPEHLQLIREYDRLTRSADADEAERSRVRQAIADALRATEEYVSSIRHRGKPGKRLQKQINFISLFGTVSKQWSPSGKPGRPRKERLSSELQQELDECKALVSEIKNSKHALGHRPEKCTASQAEKLKLIQNSYPDLYRAYQLKESLRLILHMKDPELAEHELDQWLAEAGSCGIKSMSDLASKIKRHRTNILNSVMCQANSAKSESANTTIKAMIKVARGFRNMDNLIAFIYLKCSDLVIPLSNRYQPTAEKAAELRAKDNELRLIREEKKRQAYLNAQTA